MNFTEMVAEVQGLVKRPDKAAAIGSAINSALSQYVFDPRPTVSKWQLIQACADAGITEAQIDTAVAMLTAKRQRFWRYTQIIDRDNPFASGLRSNLTPVPTPAAWNAIFLAAAALDPLTV